MIFAELVDLVLLAVNGGKFTSESAVPRTDVEAYVPKAAHAVIRNTVFGLKADGRAERGNGSIVGVLVDPAFFETYEVDLVKDDNRNIWYAPLPSIVQSWPGDAALKEVFGKQNPSVSFTKVGGPREYASMEYLSGATRMYWHEPYGTDETSHTRLYFPDAGDGLCTVMVRAALEISSNLKETRIPLPAGIEALVAQMSVEWFRGQRAFPADVRLDNQDVNAGAAQQNVQMAAQ